MRTRKRITVAFLRKHEACDDQVDLFARVFPKGADISRDNILRAQAHYLNIHWLACTILEGPALVKYERVMESALAEYHRAMASAYAEYERVKASADAEYRRVKASALADALGL
jgi:hypothetical protein